MQSSHKQHDWEELSDHENMVDEQQLEPDYFIDRPNTAQFIPNEEGQDKTAQIVNSDDDLYDFLNEIEPILQVLCGKAIEQARMEIIEDFEKENLSIAKLTYKIKRQAKLVETQRVETKRFRKNDEIERRNLQIRTQLAQSVMSERREVS